MIRNFIDSAHCSKSNDKYTINVISFNKTVQDIIWKEQLDVLETSKCMYKNLSVNIHHVLSQEQEAVDQSNYRHGRISLGLLKNILPQNLQNCDESNLLNDKIRLCCICGPIPFNREARSIFQHDFKYAIKEFHVFEG